MYTDKYTNKKVNANFVAMSWELNAVTLNNIFSLPFYRAFTKLNQLPAWQ